MRLTKYNKDDADSSEIVVFRVFVTRAIPIQGQLSEVYQSVMYLRERLQKAIDIP